LIKNKSVPFYEELSKCSKCGFCQAFCPVYAVTGIETMTARGRNAQLMGVIEGRLSIPEIEDALSSCLLCRGCLPNCYSGVRTDEVVRGGREALLEAKGPGVFKRTVFKSVLPYPKRMDAILRFASISKKTGIPALMEKVFKRKEGLRIVDALLRDAPGGTLRERFKGYKGGRGTDKKRVAYFPGCGFNYLLPDVGEATIKVTERLGYDVHIPDSNCCGLPPYAYGYTEDAKGLVKRNIEALEGFEIILTECGSCSSFLKKYAELLSGDPDYAERAREISERVVDSSEFIYKHLGQPQGAAPTPDSSLLAPRSLRVTYHDPCHLSRYQGIAKEPREIIKSISGIEFVELPEADWCCGGAGSYSIVNNEISMKILDRKMNNLKKTGADILATSCPSCMIQLSYGVRRAGVNVRIMHVNQLLAQALS
jgi:glycolate oxidase iron-sulfur subunit